MGGSSQGPQKPVCRTSKVLNVQYYTLVFKKIVLLNNEIGKSDFDN